MRRLLLVWTFGSLTVALASNASAQPQTQPPPAQTTPAPPQAQQPQPQSTSQPPQPVGTTGTIGTLPEPTAPLPMCVPPDMSTPLALLDRAQQILDRAGKDRMGKVELDRGGLDELRALVAQARAVIEPVKQP